MLHPREAAKRRAVRPAAAACAAVRRHRRHRFRKVLMECPAPAVFRLPSPRSGSASRMASVMSWVIMTVVMAELAMQLAKNRRRARRGLRDRARRTARPSARCAALRRARAPRRRAGAGRRRGSCGSRSRVLRPVEPDKVEQFIHPRGNLRGRRARQLRRDADIRRRRSDAETCPPL